MKMNTPRETKLVTDNKQLGSAEQAPKKNLDTKNPELTLSELNSLTPPHKSTHSYTGANMRDKRRIAQDKIRIRRDKKINSRVRPQSNLRPEISLMPDLGADVSGAINNLADLDMDSVNDLLKFMSGKEVKSTIGNIDTLVEKLSSSKLTNEDTQNAFANLAVKADNATTIVGTMVDKCFSLFDNLSKAKEFLGLISIVASIDACVRLNKDQTCKRAWTQLAVGTVLFSYNFGGDVVEAVSRFINSNRPQDGVSEMIDISRLLSLFLTFSLPEKQRKLAEEFFKTVGNWSRATNGIKDIVAIVIKTIERLYNFLIRKLYGPGDYRRIFATSDNPYMVEITDCSDWIENKIRNDDFSVNEENFQMLANIVSLLENMLKRVPRNNETSNMIQILFRMHSRYSKMMDVMSGYGFTNGGVRQEPVCCFFRGPPDTGKSILMSMLSTAVTLRVTNSELHNQIKEHNHNYVFYKRSGLKHFDTYTSKHIVTVLDDFGQSADTSTGEESDFMSLINMVNSIPYPLPMAELEKKGKVFFNSKFVFATTNLDVIKPVSIISPEAFKRRIHMLIRIQPKSEYCTDGKFDVSKFPIQDGKTVLSPEMCDYYEDIWGDERDKAANKVLRKFNFEELIDELVGLHDKKRENYQSLVQLRTGLFSEEQATPQIRLGDEFPDAPPFQDVDEAISVSSPRSRAVREMVGPIFTWHQIEFLAQQVGINHGTSAQMLTHLCDHYCEAIEGIVQDWTEESPILYIGRFSLYVRMSRAPSLRAIPFSTEGLKQVCSKLRDYIMLGIEKVFMRFMWLIGNIIARTGNSLVVATMIFGVIQAMVWLISYWIGAMAWRMVVSIINFFIPNLIPQDGYNTEVNSTKIERNSQKIKTSLQMKPQLGNDPNGFDILSSVIKSNCYSMYYGDKKVGYVTAIKERVFIMPWHFITHLYARVSHNPSKLNDILTLKRNTSEREISFNIFVSDLMEFHEESELQFNDLVLVQLPRTVPMHKDITSYFADEHLMKTMLNQADIVLSFPDSRTISNVITQADFRNNKRILDEDGTYYELRECFSYIGLNTQVGDCGAVALYLNPRIAKKKILGFHVAGSAVSRTGFCGAVTEEALLRAISRFKIIEVQTPEGTEEIMPQGFISEIFMPMCTTKKIPRVPAKSDLMKSPLYGVFADEAEKLAPVHMHKIMTDEGHRNLYTGFTSHTVLNIDYSSEVADELCYMRNNQVINVMPSVISFEEACEGLDEWMKGLDRSTSTGWPYNTDRKSSKKAYFFGTEPEFSYSRPSAIQLRREADLMLVNCARGIRVPQIYSDFPKDELVALKKAPTKFRPISGAGCAYTINVKRYFGKFAAYINANNINIGYAVGIDPIKDWDLLARKLLSKGEDIGAGDFKWYDKREQPCIMWSALDLINAWYDDGKENAFIRTMLWLEVVNSWHVFGSAIVAWILGMPSGNPLTIIINCIVNKLAFRKCWKILMVTLPFNEAVYLAVCGDDNVFSVLKHLTPVFNEFTIIEPMAQQGFLYTTESKDELTSYVPRGLTEVEFLKRGFRYSPEFQRWICPFRLSTALALSYWYRRGDELILKEKVWLTLRELSLHGEEVFNKYSKPLLKAYAKHTRMRYGWFPAENYLDVVEDVFKVSISNPIEFPILKTVQIRHKTIPIEANGPLALQDHSATFPESGINDSKQSHKTTARYSPTVPVPVNEQAFHWTNPSNEVVTRIPEELQIKEEGVHPQKSEQCDPVAQTTGTTQFQEDETCTAVATSIGLKKIEGLGLRSNYTDNFVKKYLSRPYLLASGVLASTDTATFADYSYPSAVMSPSMYLEKIRGHLYFKGTGVFTLRVNSTKFHCGLYKMAFVHTGGSPAPNWYNMHMLTQQQRSQLPGVLIDVSKVTSAELRIPFVNSYKSIGFGNTVPDYYDFGKLVYFPLSPLNTGVGQDPTIGYSLWFHWEDVELDMPAYPQMGTMSEREAKTKGIGPIESGSTALSKISRSLIGVPMLSDAATMATWALDIVSGVANVFGWSRPRNQDVQKLMVTDWMYNTSTADSADNSRTLAMFEKNTVEVLPGFAGTEVDELSFDAFLTIPTVLNKFSWQASNAVGSLLSTIEVSPYTAVARTLDGLAGKNNTPMSLLSDMFELYRGDIVITFMIIKTEMHSGRLSFSFQPVHDVPTGSLSLAQTNYTLREVVDLREKSIVTMKIPYHGPTQYRFTKGTRASLGKVLVHVVTELVAPTTAAQNIEILPWISAAEGFEFAVPSQTLQIPVSGLAIDPAPQSGFIGDYEAGKDTLAPARFCVGERISSLRQYLKTCRVVTNKLSTFGIGVTTIAPFIIPTLYRTGGVSNYPAVYGGHVHAFSSIFAFSRGGMRIKAIDKNLDIEKGAVLLTVNNSSISDIVLTSGASWPNGTLASSVSEALTGANVVFTDVSRRGGLEIEVPAYGHTESRANGLQTLVPTLTTTQDRAAPGVKVSFRTLSVSNQFYAFGGADDFDLGGFVSIPFMVEG